MNTSEAVPGGDLAVESSASCSRSSSGRAGAASAQGVARRPSSGKTRRRCAEPDSSLTGQSVANTSQHLQVLARAGLVASRRSGPRVFYRLASQRVLDLWLAVRDVASEHVANVEVLAEAYLGDPSEVEQIDIDEVATRLAAGSVVLLDVRACIEFRAGHLPAAVSVPIADLARASERAAAGRDRRLLPRLSLLRLRQRRRAVAARARASCPPARCRSRSVAASGGCPIADRQFDPLTALERHHRAHRRRLPGGSRKPGGHGPGSSGASWASVPSPGPAVEFFGTSGPSGREDGSPIGGSSIGDGDGDGSGPGGAGISD